MTSPGGQVLELNVGGVLYTTSPSSLGPLQSRLEDPTLPRDAKGRLFLDRDGVLFRYILDFLRSGSIVLPDCFREKERLKREALHYGLQSMADSLSSLSRTTGYITIGYRGSFQFGRDGLTDVKFRKISRILVCGRVALCRTVFGETLNESRDPDHGCSDRYTARFFLKHSSIEQAFDQLQENGFRMTGSCGSGTAGIAAADLKPGVDQEENRWNHYNDYISPYFLRPTMKLGLDMKSGNPALNCLMLAKPNPFLSLNVKATKNHQINCF